MDAASNHPDLALGIEELEPLQAPSTADFEQGVLVGIGLVAIGVATFAIVT